MKKVLLTNPNIKELKRLINFFSRENEDGYVFAYAEDSSLIPKINKELNNSFASNAEEIAVIYLNSADDTPIIKKIEDKLTEKKYRGVIIANLYDYISDSERGQENLNEINFSRESFYTLEKPILFWITQSTFALLSNKATDLYSQRRLSVITFEAEEKELQINAPLPEVFDKKPQSSNRQILLKEQFEDALNSNIKGVRLTNDFLLPYLEELANNFNKEEVLQLLEEYGQNIDKSSSDNSIKLAKIYSDIHIYDKAIRYASYAIEELLQVDDQYSLFYAYTLRADNFVITGDLERGLSDYQTANEVMLKLHENNVDNVVFKNGLAVSYEKLGDTYRLLGDLEKTLKYYENDLKLTKELYESSTNSSDFKISMAVSYGRLGDTHRSLGDLEKTLKYYEDAAKLFKELYANNSDDVAFKNGLAISYEKLGYIHRSYGDLEAALKYYKYATVLFEELYANNSNNVAFQNSLAVSYERLGDIYRSLGKMRVALKYYKDTTKLFKELYTNNSENVVFKNGLAISYEKLGDTHRLRGDLATAWKYYRDETKLFEELYASNSNNAGFKNGMAASYLRLGVLEIEKTHNRRHGFVLLYKSKSLLKELKDSFPTNKEFQSNYKLVLKNIESLKKM